MKNWVPIFLCLALGVCSAVMVVGLEQWALPERGGDPLDLILGLGFLSIFPGLLWARLERGQQDLGPGRRRLLFWAVLGQMLVGGGCGLLLAGMTLAFGQAMTALGFHSLEGNSPKALALGMMYGCVPGLGLGYLAALTRSFFWTKRRPGNQG